MLGKGQTDGFFHILKMLLQQKKKCSKNTSLLLYLLIVHCTREIGTGYLESYDKLSDTNNTNTK